MQENKKRLPNVKMKASLKLSKKQIDAALQKMSDKPQPSQASPFGQTGPQMGPMQDQMQPSMPSPMPQQMQQGMDPNMGQQPMPQVMQGVDEDFLQNFFRENM